MGTFKRMVGIFCSTTLVIVLYRGVIVPHRTSARLAEFEDEVKALKPKETQ